MNRTDLVTLRMYPWRGAALEAGQYLRHDGPRAKTAYFVVSARSPERWAWIVKAQRLPIAEIPADAVAREFHWHKRERKAGRKLRAA